jgi:cell wall-associated NlpC family hydrolase
MNQDTIIIILVSALFLAAFIFGLSGVSAASLGAVDLFTYASRYIGTASGSTQYGRAMDCSALFWFAAKDAGYTDFPATAETIYHACSPVNEEQAKVLRGSFVFFTEDGSSSSIYHIEMSNGAGQVLATHTGSAGVGLYRWGWWSSWTPKSGKKVIPLFGVYK